MNKPNMVNEIIEAIHMNFEDYPSVEVDCYLCLTGLEGNELANKLSEAGINALKEMKRCTNCGNLMENYTYKEQHNELDAKPYELFHESYCPNCLGRND